MRPTALPTQCLGGATSQRRRRRSSAGSQPRTESEAAWNRGPLTDLAGRPLEDGRVNVLEGDVAETLSARRACYDSILLDVDNGPESFTRGGNDWLYGKSGVAAAFRALRPGGVFAVWSAEPNRRFAARLCRAGFKVDDLRVPARGDGGGPDHTIWIAVTPG